MEKALPAEAMENADANDPTDPIDRADPTEPIDRTEFFEAMQRSDSSDHRESVELRDRVTSAFCPVVRRAVPPPSGGASAHERLLVGAAVDRGSHSARLG
ncbi:MAG: hypothetical protein JO265_14775 [Acidimicrobiia bacterium]|nr:hypothetical protein [Acidimicrobiia bacterium]